MSTIVLSELEQKAAENYQTTMWDLCVAASNFLQKRLLDEGRYRLSSSKQQVLDVQKDIPVMEAWLSKLYSKDGNLQKVIGLIEEKQYQQAKKLAFGYLDQEVEVGIIRFIP